MSPPSMITLGLLASTLTPTVPFPTTTTSQSQAQTGTDSTGVFHTACIDLHNYNSGSCGSIASSSALCCGESLTMWECASTFCSGTPTRSLVACSSAITTTSLLDEPAYIAAKPTSSDTTSSDIASSKSAISTTSSDIASPRTSTSPLKSSISSNTESSTTSRKKSTSSSSASISLSTETSSPATSSSVSPSRVTTTSPGSSISPSEIGHAGLSPGTPTSETPAVVQTLYSTLKPTTPTHSVGVPANAPIGAGTSALSTGAEAGIGVGAGAGLLLLLTAVMLILFKKRRTRDESPQHDAGPMGDQQPPSTSTTQSSRPDNILSQQQHPNPQARVIWHRRPPPHHNDLYDDVPDNALLEVGVGGSEVPVDMRRQDVGAGGATATLTEPDFAPRSYLPDHRPLARGPFSTSSSSIVAGRGSRRVSQYQPYRDHRYQPCASAGPAGYLRTAPSPSLGWWQQQQQQQHQRSFHPSYGADSRASLAIRGEEKEEPLPGHSRDVPPEALQCALDGTCHDMRWGLN